MMSKRMVYDGKVKIPLQRLLAHCFDVGLGRRRPERRSQAFIEFDEEGLGKFQFGSVRAVTDHYRTKKRDRMRIAQFCWDGEDGADGTPLDGVGWVILEGGKMTGTICIHLGDELEFVAKKSKALKTVKRI